MPTLADVKHHLGMARAAVDSLYDDDTCALAEVDRLRIENEALDVALERLATRLEPCTATDAEGRRCQLRRHDPVRHHTATILGVTYQWSEPVERSD